MNSSPTNNACMVVDDEAQSYFWCTPDTLEALTEWIKADNIEAVKANTGYVYISWKMWQSSRDGSCYCDGRGD
jgi:hypothetical protein